MNIRDRIKELRRVPANELRPNPKNWRTHPEKQLNAIRGVLAEVGFAGAELARELEDGTLELIDGHARAEVAGTAEVPVLVLDVNEAEANKILATFDPIGAMADSDAAKLDAVLRDVETANEDLSQMIADLADGAGLYLDDVASEIEEDEVPEPPAEPITKPGDVWILGKHRLLCGDCTIAENFKIVTNGDSVDLVFTDPPYGIDYQDLKKSFAKIENDATDPTSLITECLRLVGSATTYLCCNWKCMQPMVDSLLAVGNQPKACIVWDKQTRIQNLDKYAKRHEFIIYAGPFGGQKTIDEDVWQVKRQTRNDHPTSKPVELVAKAIEHSSSQDAVVYDPFLGSGSTLIAAEQLGRTCYGMELSPQYCDVIVERWQNLTGEKAQRGT